jgi:hypothetical protein
LIAEEFRRGHQVQAVEAVQIARFLLAAETSGSVGVRSATCRTLARLESAAMIQVVARNLGPRMQ